MARSVSSRSGGQAADKISQTLKQLVNGGGVGVGVRESQVARPAWRANALRCSDFIAMPHWLSGESRNFRVGSDL